MASNESVVFANSLEGNIFTGLRLIGGNVIVKQDTLLKFDTLEVKYDVLSLLNKKIVLKKIALESPQINLTKIKGRGDTLLWNFEYMLRSEKVKTDTAKKPFDWGIFIHDLVLHNADIRIIGSNPAGIPARNVKMARLKTFDLNNLDVTDLDADIEAVYSSDLKMLNVKSLSLNTNSDFAIQKLNFLAKADPGDTTVRLSSFDLATKKTKLSIGYIYMNNFDPFGSINYEDFKNNSVKIHLSGDNISFQDLKFFLPQLDFMDGSASLILDADGTYGNLNVKKCVIKTNISYLNLKGKIQNLSNPDKLYLDITAQNMVIDPADTKNILPGLSIPDFISLGKVYADVQYTGEPRNFTTVFAIKSSAGNASGSLQLDVGKVNPDYKTSFVTQGLNLGALTKNKDLESNINLKADISGSGFDINSMASKINYELINSKMYGIDVVKSAGTLDIFHKDVNADITYQSDHLQTSLKGKVNLDNFSEAEYTAKGEAHNLDLSEYTKNHNDRSSLNFAFDVSGKGLSFDNVDGTFNLELSESYYSSYHFPPTPVTLKVNNSHQNGTIDLSTKYFDFRAKGKMDFTNTADVLHENLSIITDEIDRNINGSSAGLENSSSVVQHNNSEFDVEYEFKAKDISPIFKIFDTTSIRFIGDVNGSIKNSSSGFSSMTRINIKDFSFPDSSFVLQDFNSSIDFKNDYSKTISGDRSPIYSIISDVEINGSSMRTGDSHYDKISAGLNLNDGAGNFYVKSNADSNFIVDLKGNADIGKELVKLNLDKVYLRYNNFDIKNNNNIIVDYDHSQGSKTFTIEQFNLNNDFMKLNASGTISATGNSDLDIESKDINAAGILELMFPQDSLNKTSRINYRSPVKGNIRRLSVYVKGSISQPEISLEMNSDLLRYESNKIGRIDAFLDYKNSTLSTDVLVSNAMGNGKLRLTGDIPYTNPFNKNDTSGYADIVNNPVDVKVSASNFQVNFFSKLIPHFAEITGILDGEIDSKGTIAKPILTGEMNITNGRFFFGLTGMYHRFTTKLRTENSNLVVDNFRILNLNDDSRHLDLWGTINFEGFTIRDINLTSSGDIVVMDQSVDENELGFYGNMIMGVGNPTVTVKGDLHKLFIDGQLLIKSANLRFPTVPTTAYDINSDNFVYKMLADTSGKVFKDTVIIVTPDMVAHVDPFLRAQVVSGSEATSVPTNFVYNLNIKTINNAYVTIDFNDITKEQLFGEIKVDLDMSTTARGAMQLFGNLYITGDSYYKFYRNFKVQDSRIIFRGYPYNPTLDIHATYSAKQIASDITTSTASDNSVIKLDIVGTKNKPQLTLRLFVNDEEVTGPDAQSDAISYLLFGVSKNSLLKGGQNVEVAKNIGTTTSLNYLSSVFGNALKDIAPFIINTELNYTEGNVATGTDIRVTSEFGDATVRVGGKILSGIGNAEVTVDYPLNKMLNMNLSNNLILEVFRVIDDNSLSGLHSVLTGARLIYRIHY